MFTHYQGRIIAALTILCAMTVWNTIFYGYYDYSFNIFIDLPFSIIIMCVAWWLASFYDKSKALLSDLGNSEDRYKKLLDLSYYVFDNLNEAVYQTDKDGNLTFLNQAWESLTGFSEQESLGRRLLTFVYPEDFQHASVISAQSIVKRQEVIQEELRFRKKGGGFIWLQTNTKVSFNEKNRVVSSVGTLTDITEWKNSKEELLQLNENLAIRSDKLSVIAQMSAAIAHEVRNPLTSISGFLQLLQQQQVYNKEYIEIIFEEIKRIEIVLNEMLILSKPQAVTYTSVDLTRTLYHVVTLIRSEANMKSIELIIDTENTPVWVYGAENQLKQVLINLIKNAIEAMENGGKIRIYQAVDRDHISIYVKDEGCGISSETLKTIGQPFYTTKEKGTGLGLTTCFKIIENHKGKIHVTSQVGVGTTFEIILPYYSEEQQLLTSKAK